MGEVVTVLQQRGENASDESTASRPQGCRDALLCSMQRDAAMRRGMKFVAGSCNECLEAILLFADRILDFGVCGRRRRVRDRRDRVGRAGEAGCVVREAAQSRHSGLVSDRRVDEYELRGQARLTVQSAVSILF